MASDGRQEMCQPDHGIGMRQHKKQRSGKKLISLTIAAFQVCESEGATFLCARVAHARAAMPSLTLPCWGPSLPVGPEVCRPPGLGRLQGGIKGQQDCGPLL